MSGVTYTLERYQTYMNLPEADEAKKSVEMQWVTETLHDLQPSHHVLDIGTATGRYAVYFAERGCHVTGVDVSDVALTIAQQNVEAANCADRVHLHRMNVLNLEFLEDSFDLVTCMMGTICHVPNEQKMLAFEEIHRVLRPGGQAILTFWDPDCSMTNYLSFYEEAERDLLRAQSLTMAECRELVQDCGFSEVHTHAFPHGHMYAILAKK